MKKSQKSIKSEINLYLIIYNSSLIILLHVQPKIHRTEMAEDLAGH